MKSFAYVMEVRFKGKLNYKIELPEEQQDMKLPVLSLLPLLENVIVHNRIDSNHRMTISVKLRDNMLSVENSIFPKFTLPESNGTGLDNLNKRFQLMTGKEIKVEDDGKRFRVFLPLIKE